VGPRPPPHASTSSPRMCSPGTRRPDDTHTEHAMPHLALSPVPPDRAEADLLVLPVAAGADGPVAPPATEGGPPRIRAGPRPAGAPGAARGGRAGAPAGHGARADPARGRPGRGDRRDRPVHRGPG